MMDWDRIRIFNAVAAAGSFTRAADRLALSQSAISRQIGALEETIGTPLFHRHARGLILTEQGEVLLKTAEEIARKIATVETTLSEVRDEAAGHLKINATVGIGTVWLTSHLFDFRALYPDITLELVVTDSDLDLSMREADVAIRLQRPTQPDLVQRKLMTVHTHIYGSRRYLDAQGEPVCTADLDRHSLIAYGDKWQPPVPSLNWILSAGRDEEEMHGRRATLTINNVFGMLRACEGGLGLASLPDYLGGNNPALTRVLPEVEGPTFTAYFVYPEELRASRRVAVFRDFLLEKVAAHPIW
jgi:DNA-binding transcriptional LysR family regulator